MDPMIDFVRQRTTDLQRTAEIVRRDRELRAAAASAPAAMAASTVAAFAGVATPVVSAVTSPSGQSDDPCQSVACAPASVRHAA